MTRSAFFGTALTVVMALAGSTGGAHHRPVLVNGERVAADSTQDCECRARGKAFKTGEQICLNGTLAICEMDQNVTTWRGTSKACPVSRRLGQVAAATSASSALR